MKTQHQSRCSQPFAFWDRLTVHMVFIMFMEIMIRIIMLQSRIIAQKKWKIRLHRREDETTVINQEIALIGRADRGGRNAKRKDISSLVKELNPEQEWIVLDHQPSEYKKAENTGCDMILSGHTHAGQIWPVGLFASLFHFDELNYGEQKQGNLDAIVTSGIAGWGYPIRTEKHSEYVVVNLIS